MVKFKHALHGFDGPTGCLWAWWWHVWRGWRTSWCPQTDPPDMLRLPPTIQRENIIRRDQKSMTEALGKWFWTRRLKDKRSTALGSATQNPQLENTPARRQWQRSGNASRSWNPEQSHEPDAGTEACGSATLWTSGTDGSHEEPQFLDWGRKKRI